MRVIETNTRIQKEHFCPLCGKDLVLKRIKKGRNTTYRRSLRSYICTDCGYAEYDSNQRELAITAGEIWL